MPIKEPMKRVEKVWGEELWLVNSPLYCGKLLLLDKNAKSSLHYHKDKRETFYCIEGHTELIVEGKSFDLNPMSRAKTILPGEKHQFIGIEHSVIIEISSEHKEEDVFRLSESLPGNEYDYDNKR